MFNKHDFFFFFFFFTNWLIERMKSFFQTVQSGEDNDTICSKCDKSDINTELKKLIGEDVKVIY